MPHTTPATPPTLDAQVFRFLATAPLALAPVSPSSAGTPAVRSFAGVAYSGGVIKGHYAWGNVVFDLATLQVPQKFAALINHDTNARCGFVTAHQISDQTGLTVQGSLLSSAEGQRVALDSDAGFPWQMSVHIEPGSIDEIGQGSTALVNGQQLSGPLTIFRNARIREVSFCAVGYDAATSATAFAFTTAFKPQVALHASITTPGETPMSQTPAERIAELETQNAALTTQRDTLLVASAAALKASRSQELTGVFSKLGLPASEADLAPFIGMDANAYSAVVNTFSKTVQAATNAASATKPGTGLSPALFSHQVTNGAAPTPTTLENPMLKDAQARAAKFAKA